MRCLFTILLGAALAAPASAQSAPFLPFTSAMIDRAIFREGEVLRTVRAYGGWTVTCDAVPRLARNFCSLQSAPAAVGAARVALTVSTGDDGRPAALLRLPFGLALSAGVTIGVDAARHDRARQVPIAMCDATACVAVWTMAEAELDALRRGQPIEVTVRGWTPSRSARDVPPPVSIAISGAGFPEALSASAH